MIKNKTAGRMRRKLNVKNGEKHRSRKRQEEEKKRETSATFLSTFPIILTNWAERKQS